MNIVEHSVHAVVQGIICFGRAFEYPPASKSTVAAHSLDARRSERRIVSSVVDGHGR